MKLKLNKWQITFLFLPFIVALLIPQIPSADIVSFRIANLLTAFGLCLIICYQAYLAIGFNNHIDEKVKWFNINARIPVAFTIIHLMYVSYYTFIKPVHAKLSRGPIKLVDFNLMAIITIMLLIHAGVTFFFINNQFVSNKIKNLKNKNEQERLTTTYLNAMRWLTKFSLAVFAVEILLSAIFDIIRYKYLTTP